MSIECIAALAAARNHVVQDVFVAWRMARLLFICCALSVRYFSSVVCSPVRRTKNRFPFSSRVHIGISRSRSASLGIQCMSH